MASLPIQNLKTDNPKAVAFVQEINETVENIPSKGAAHLRRLTELANTNSSPFHLGSRSVMFPKRREVIGNNGIQSSGQLPQEYKSSQGFFISENLFSQRSPQHMIMEGFNAAKSAGNSSCHNLNHNNNNNHNSSWQLGGSSHKWSQEQLFSSFYKMRENSDVILIPDKFWKQEKPFVPFKQVWAEHEHQNADLINDFTLKKRMFEHNQDDKSLNQHSNAVDQSTSSNNLKKLIGNKSEEENSSYLPLGFTQLTHKPVTRNYFHNHHHQSDATREGELNKKIAASVGKHFSFQDKKRLGSIDFLIDSSRQMSSQQQLINGNGRKSKGNYLAKSSQAIDTHDKSASGFETSQFYYKLNNRSEAISSHKNGQYSYGKSKQHHSMMNLPNSSTQQQPNQSLQDLTTKDEIEIQLNQNKYSRDVYDTTLSSIEQFAFADAYDKIQTSFGQIDKIQKHTKVYNKRSPLDQVEETLPLVTGGTKRSSALAINEREAPVLTPSIMYCWVENDRDSWKPQPRMGTTLVSVGTTDFQRIYLIGGISSEMVKDVLVINPEDFTFDTLQHIEEQHNEEMDIQRENLLKRRMASQKKLSKLVQKVPLTNIGSGGNTLNTPKRQVSQQIPVQAPSDFEDLASKYLFSNGNFSQRFNHTTVETTKKSKFLIFGGEILTQEQQSAHSQSPAASAEKSRQKFRALRRNCLNDLISFDVLTREWRVHVGRGDVIEARRNHTATMVSSKHMAVVGGLNSEGHALFDICVLDTTTFRWVIFNNFYNLYLNPFPAGIAFHAACFIAEEENSPAFNVLGTNSLSAVFKEAKKNVDKNAPPQQFLKEEGLYVFGGIDDEGNYHKNKMMVLKQVANPPNWIELSTTGRGPEKRCMHTMNFMFNMSLLVIYGGKYESASATKYYDDLFALNLKTLAWIEVSQQGQRRPPRAMHCACVSHKQLIVFGGLNNNGFLKGDIEIIEFDQTLVMKMKRIMNYTLTLYQQMKHKRFTQIEEQNLLINQQQKASEDKEEEDNNNQQGQKVTPAVAQKQTVPVIQKLKARVNLIDPERERELKEITDIPAESGRKQENIGKWKAPFKPKSLLQQANTTATFLAKTFQPMPAHCGKRPDV